MQADFDVAIVGYGPVGALTALSLADAGLHVVVLERSIEATDLPRAVALDGETLRAFQRLGLAEQVSALCQPPREPHAIGFANSRRETLFSMDVPHFGPNGWCDVLFFDQPELEAALRRIVASDDRIEVRLGERVDAIRQDASGVELHSIARGDTAGTQYRARFAVGCDGASSFVREAIGAGWRSLDYDQDWLVLDIVQGPGAKLPLQTLQVCDPARLASYICVKDPNRRWEFQLLEGETREQMESPEKIRELLAPWIEPENYELRRSAVYQFHAAIADRWRVGRVFLAGDAAHQTPPFLGQGLNAGFRDAMNLAWKLPLVLAGVCDESLLDSYAVERDPHARELVDRAVGIGKLMETLAAREAGRPDPHPPGSMAIDPDGPLVPPLRAGILIAEQSAHEHRVGELFRQPRVRARDGRTQRLDHALGGGFCVVGKDWRNLELKDEGTAILERLGGRRVALADFELVQGKWDALFGRSPAAVIRPDRTIFGVVDESLGLDALLAELGRQLRLTSADTPA